MASLRKQQRMKKSKERRQTRHKEKMASQKREVHLEKDTFRPTPLVPKTYNQGRYITNIENDAINLGIGYAGTGKTYIATRVIAEMYRKGELDRIIVSTPTVECGDSLGMLPGEIDDKFRPYLIPFQEGFIDALGIGKYKCDIRKVGSDLVLPETGIIPFPVQFMRGMSLNNTGLIIDEGQNLTRTQAKMIITRLGRNCKVIICGDTRQSDLGNEKSGLGWLVAEIRRQHKPIEIVEFEKEDCVRSDECMMMLDLIDNSEEGW